MERYSEPYNATGGLAAEGVLNQLGRPDIEPLEVLVREAVQNCWDAKRKPERGVSIEIGRTVLRGDKARRLTRDLLADPPPNLPLADALGSTPELLYFADFGTSGLGGPTRADQHVGDDPRDFVDFVRNIGQPPDKDLAGGSFGYGKAAFYIASAARTIVVDTLCDTGAGALERRLIGCALGENYVENGAPFTGRHWWGRLEDGVPEPLTGNAANGAAAALGLPEREGADRMGTTVAIVAPSIRPDAPDDMDTTMEFVADSVVWNFWPRMTNTPGGARASMEFEIVDDGVQVPIPDPRTHERLRGFVEAMDQLREEAPEEEPPLTLDRSVRCFRPVQTLGRLVIQRGPVAPVTLPDRAVPEGARLTANGLHHVALMRNAELIVKYLRGPESVSGRMGYSGAFRCALDVDEAFRQAEPPTHDDWVPRFLPRGHNRTFVKVALDRIVGFCREAAGFDASGADADDALDVPLGEFADALATLMPSLEGPGARRNAGGGAARRTRRARAPGRSAAVDASAGVWVDASPSPGGAEPAGAPSGHAEAGASSEVPEPPRPRPQIRPGDDPRPALRPDGSAVLLYPFELRGRGNNLVMSATIEVMTNDGGQVEDEPPLGESQPEVRAWIDPTGDLTLGPSVEIEAEDADGIWTAVVPAGGDAMMRVAVTADVQ